MSVPYRTLHEESVPPAHSSPPPPYGQPAQVPTGVHVPTTTQAPGPYIPQGQPPAVVPVGPYAPQGQSQVGVAPEPRLQVVPASVVTVHCRPVTVGGLCPQCQVG